MHAGGGWATRMREIEANGSLHSGSGVDGSLHSGSGANGSLHSGSEWAIGTDTRDQEALGPTFEIVGQWGLHYTRNPGPM